MLQPALKVSDYHSIAAILSSFFFFSLSYLRPRGSFGCSGILECLCTQYFSLHFLHLCLILQNQFFLSFQLERNLLKLVLQIFHLMLHCFPSITLCIVISFCFAYIIFQAFHFDAKLRYFSFEALILVADGFRVKRFLGPLGGLVLPWGFEILFEKRALDGFGDFSHNSFFLILNF